MISSPPLTDRELLAAFVKTADGAAFAVLTERHLGFVFGVACRRTGSREMAQEAAQNTFCQLARKAASLLPAMREGVSLGPWLHAVSLREAGTLMRAEAVRQRTLRSLADSTASAQSPFSPSPPPLGSEHLDEALAALPEAGRRVLILRYLQGLSLQEVASEENTSEEAARKRVTRALDRLTRLLARRGVTAPGVTACLAAAPVLWPAPSSAAALAARATQQAALSATGAGLSGLGGFALSQWPVAAVFLLAAVPAAWPWGVEESPFTKNEPSGHIAGVAGTGEGPPGKGLPADPADSGMVSGMAREMRRFAAREWKQRDVTVAAGSWRYREGFDEFSWDAARLAATRRAVLDFSQEEVREALRSAEGQPWGEIIDQTLYARWAELMPEEARQAALTAKTTGALEGVLRAQAATDLPGTLPWAATHAPDKCQALLEPLMRANPREYLRLMQTIMSEGAGPNRNNQFYRIFPYAPELALEGWRESEKSGKLDRYEFDIRCLADTQVLKPAQADSIASFAAGLPEDSALRAECLRAVSRLRFAECPDRAADSLVSSRMPAEEERGIIRSLTELLTEWKEKDPTAAAAWLGGRSGLDPDTQARLARLASLTLPPAETPDSVTAP